MRDARKAVLRAADAHVEALRRLVLRMARVAQARAPETLPDDAGRAFVALGPALDTADRVLARDLARLLDAIVAAGGEASIALGEIRALARRRRAFNRTDPEVLNWVERHAGLAIRDISAGSRKAIRLALVDGFKKGLSASEIADMIRPFIGLSERQAATALRRFEAARRVMSERRAIAVAKRYAKRALRERALTIARDQAVLAANEGQRLAWLQARRRGEITATMRRQWVTARDERVCPVCAPMDGEVVGLDEPFSLGGPPAHPRCRCGQVLVPQQAARTRKIA